MARMNTKVLVSAAMGLVVGGVAGYLMQPAQDAAVTSAARPHRIRGARVAEVDQQNTINTLRKRVKDLEQRLAVMTEAAAMLTNAPTATRAEQTPQRFGPPNAADMRARMEEMKKNDPARYAQMTNNMAQWRRRMSARTQDRLEFFASLDTASMSPKQRENHEKLQALLARREELMRMLSPEDASVTDAQREKAHQEMRGTWNELRKLESAERDMLLSQTARNLGFKGEDAKEIVETIKTIYDATQGGGRGGRGGRGPGGPGGLR